MIPEHYFKEKQAFIFELDNVIYPEKDYLLQVYYLFAQFMEYGEQLNAADVLHYMQQIFTEEGPECVFDKTAAKFNIDEKYRVNFDMLLHSVRLPLKLLIFNEVLNALQSIVLERKQLFLLVSGNPAMQLNKIKQTEWNGLEKYLTVYFAEELDPTVNALEFIADQHALKKEDMLLVGKTDFAGEMASNVKISYLQVDDLFVN
ncbi:FMN phosphatase YigB (HAD superfamily) [Pedobacter africanus]|uniref:FMN phosphatase YigB (HAD superfamily) n=1 Tax=Pedobacter africanus TaxID=151894 RepID=A0ACC6L0V1_9SPHI|nr:haloacid dehalogenase [Pedobacter africanus]MDR6785060.1 FMN phosphatase YigB (HAD superfamily) [Pedobacter africanus]